MAHSSPQAVSYCTLPSRLSDAGKYSYCAMCALAMHELYNNEWDRPFTKHCLDLLLAHVKLPKSVNPAMQALMSGDVEQSFQPCFDVLKGEKALAADCSVILYDFILVAVKDGSYDARWRVLVQYLAEQLGIANVTIETYERSVIDCITRVVEEKSKSEQEESKSKKQIAKFKRYALVGLASIGGGALIGLTGGLATPLIAGGLSTLGLGGSAAILGTTIGVAVVGSLFGAAGAGLTGYKMHKRVGEIEEFAFDRLELEQTDNNNEPVIDKVSSRRQQLHISILISGWLKDESADNYVRPWVCVRASQEQYYLRYESRYLLEFGRAIEYILSMAFSFATQEVLKYTALSGLLSAVAWPGALLGLANIIDNPWSVCCRRSAQVGKQLAEVLLAREQGHRPVTLVGFSIGARVIYYCLREMAERGRCEGIVQDAVLIGAPCSGEPESWRKLTRVVAGRLINGYCRTDWLLKFLYRTLSMTSQDVAGLNPIEVNDRRICNVDLSEIVSGHSDYSDKICLILRTMKIRVKEGPCGDVKIPKAQTMDHLSTNLKNQSPMQLRRTWSVDALTSQKTQDAADDDMTN